MRTFGPALIVAGTVAGLFWSSTLQGADTQDPAASKPEAPRATGARRWYQGPGLVAFQAGYLAWEQGDWKTTRSKMQEALTADADQPEANVKTYGSGWISPYLPTYYLGLARCKADHCSENVDEILRLIKDTGGRLARRHQSDCQKQDRCAVPPP